MDEKATASALTLGAKVKINASGRDGQITGVVDYFHLTKQYLVEYVIDTGTVQQEWFTAGQITGA